MIKFIIWCIWLRNGTAPLVFADLLEFIRDHILSILALSNIKIVSHKLYPYR